MSALGTLVLLTVLVQSFLLGYLFVKLYLPGSRHRSGSQALGMALAFGSGVGLSSAAYLVLYRIATPFTGWCFALEIAVVGVLAWRVLRTPRAEPSEVSAAGKATPNRGLLAIAMFLVVNTLVRGVTLSFYQPHGATDAFTMWNVRARYLFFITDDWASAFARSFNTPDYPLLLPAFVARAWKAIDADPTLVPSTVALLFTCATILCLFAVVRLLRGRDQACLATIGLLSAPEFIAHGASQYADIVMAYFMCSAVGTACVRKVVFPDDTGLLSLVGFLAGLAAWTKNEGVLFSLSLAIALGVVAWREGRQQQVRAELGPFFKGLALPFLTLLYFKIFVVPPSEFISEQAGWGAMLNQVLDLDRHFYLMQTAAHLFVYFAVWPSILPAIILLGLCVGIQVRQGERALLAYPGLVLIQMCLGYSVLCIIGPHEFKSYVDYSAFRLLVQLWPLVMLLAFLIIKPFPGNRMADS